ncbi:MAG: hypothetical protein ACI9K5_002338 [Gammaproteobacteria bacterium]|jgi:uncharacterized protein (DUF885 family)
MFAQKATVPHKNPMSTHRMAAESRQRASCRSALSLGLSLSLLFLGAGCTAGGPPRTNTTTAGPLERWSDSAAGVTHPGLTRLVKESWEAWLRANPFEASRLGDARYHGSIPILNDVEIQRRREELSTFAERLAQIEDSKLNPADRLTRSLLAESFESELAVMALELHKWMVDPLFGPHLQVLGLTKTQPVGSRRERELLVQRWQQLDSYLLRIGDNLLRGAKGGKVASQTAIQKSIRQLEAILDTSPLESPLVLMAASGGRWVELPPFGSVSDIAMREFGDARKQSLLRRANPHLQDGERLVSGTRVLIPNEDDLLSPEERGTFLYEVLQAVEEEIYPAFATYRSILVDQLLPIARDDSKPGIWAVPGGIEAYPVLIQETTSLPLAECDPKEIHTYGLQEVARIRAEIANLGEQLFGTRVISEIQQQLRSNPAMFFGTREEVEQFAVDALARAEAAAPNFFGRLPLAACVVERLPSYEEQDSTTAYYNAPEPGGGRPGRYYINTYGPETRPRFEAAVLAYHEAVPGHHLQLAIQQELTNLPRFRRHLGCEAYVEGWALYSERLSEEMGLYTDDLDRMGMLSFDAWRASRLVVDTGLHAMKWPRETAIQYLFENTLLSRENIVNEVDRYIAWPSQALAYKLGQREFLSLRDLARDTLGEEFSYAEFHDLVLGQGALSLGALRSLTLSWLGIEEAPKETAGLSEEVTEPSETSGEVSTEDEEG